MGNHKPIPTQDGGERAIVATLVLPGSAASEAEDPLEEIRGLAAAAGANVVDGVYQKLNKVNPRAAFGKGKIEEIAQLAKAQDAVLLVVDHDLSPSQGRNLEKDLGIRVIDRTELILDIFSTRAQTKQAKLQVELAQSEYMKTRLMRMWTHLERTEGAIGSRGPGETQLETDRRLVNKKISDLRKRLKLIEGRRHREAISREYPYTISLVGYTNAGKSSLLRRLTGADVFVADQLFATLDTRIRNWRLKDTREVLLADTVGFVRDLPHGLVASFHATLEETLNADLLLHICDASAIDLEVHMSAVNGVLAEIEADGIPLLIILNKWDRVDEDYRLILLNRFPDAIPVSAHSGEGLDGLEEVIGKYLDNWSLHLEVEVPASDGRLLADFRRISRVLQETYEEGNWVAEVTLSPRHWNSLRPQLLAQGGEFKVVGAVGSH
ncbi:MAG: GTPase HflX [Planctomycetota bacterium]|nr:GTPase HflX [Planctomycetota bacterium]MDA1113808.1 GTPase HflX [Planctomycetota bacterium]